MDFQEKILIEKAKKGDEGSFETLILSCKGKAYNIALRYMRNEEDAGEVLQESFIKIFRHLDKFNYNSRFDTWVYRIVVNTCNDLIRKNLNRKEFNFHYEGDEGYEDEIPIVDSSPTPEEVVIRKENMSYVMSCLDKIGKEHKEIIILRDIQGFSYDEISQITECTVGTIKSRLNRARNKLRKIYFENVELNE
ncbi:RNA polymerase sigma factor [Anaerovorax odorimutans]|uniref:RNA polymerase sigma factor n=1 Tax=Anaerovorax odorimutans TaxID=109327 RepID=UPI00041C76DD|nr:RNA polymerase sigma factor [Anaerovorax odorimutans]